MRIEVVDPGGGGLGLAIGLAQLGHEVVHRGPTSWATASPESWARCSRELQRRFLRTPTREDPEPDLLVLVDVFADLWWSLARAEAVLPVEDGTDPLRDDAGPLVYPARLEWYCERARAAGAVAVVDMSDRGEEREVAFEAVEHAVLFARECPAAGDGPWRPFPFLFNQALLWLELLRPRREWWIEPAARRYEHDWVFCGSVDHPRYGGRRREALAALQSRWPERRGLVQSTAPFVDVLRLLQSARFGIDLPGAGELCFRLHECLALGTPVVRPLPAGIALPCGLAEVVADDPTGLRTMDPATVREVQAAHYSPQAAARWLLAGIAAGRPVVGVRGTR